MGTQNGHTLLQRFSPDIKHGNSLAHADCINLIPCRELLPGFNDVIKISVACLFSLPYSLNHAFPLGFALAQKVFVTFVELMQGFFFCFSIFIPNWSLLFVFFLIFSHDYPPYYLWVLWVGTYCN